MVRTYSAVPPTPQPASRSAQSTPESAQRPSSPAATGASTAYVPPRMKGATEIAQKIDSPVKDAAMVVGGVGLMAVGVPMLVLPGPGVAAIAGGAALAGKGAKSLFSRGKKDARPTASHPAGYTRVP